jgi:ABC-2 type transport system ATP-binding protein
MNDLVLEANHITKSYKNNRGIRNVSLTLRQGEIYGLVGPNGAGKTTLLKAITGLVRPDQGHIKILGHALDSAYEQAMEHMGCLIEEPALLEDLTAYRNLLLHSRYYAHAGDQHIMDLLEKVDILHAKDEKVKRFSQGMKQRLGIAMALLGHPAIICLDEPTNGLDVEGILQYKGLIQSLAQQSQTTFLISSHHMAELESLCSRVGIIYEGQLIAEEHIQNINGGNAMLETWYIERLSRHKGGVVHV